MIKYQTQRQILLDILYDIELEELELSQQRIETLKAKGYDDTLEIELEVNQNLVNNIDKINDLIEIYKNEGSTSPSVVEMGYENHSRDVWHSYVSGLLKHKTIEETQ